MPLEGEQLGFLEKVIKLEAKYGLGKILKAIVIIGLFVFVMYNAQNFDEYVTRIVDNAVTEQSERTQEHHDASIQYRYSIKEEMDDILHNLLEETKCDRVFVMEMHNGTNNPSGLSFLSASMTYETVREGITHIDDDYGNILLSRFRFPSYLKNNHFWQGNMTSLANVDSKLALRMQSNDVEYLFIIELYGIKTEIGYLGVTYCNSTPLSERELQSAITVAAQKVTILLDVNNPMNTLDNGNSSDTQ